MKNGDPKPNIVQDIPTLGTVIFPSAGKKKGTL